MNFHSVSALTALKELGSDAQDGLSQVRAGALLRQNGENILAKGKKVSLLRKLLAQFADLSIIILFVACAVSLVTGIIDKDGDLVDPIIILAIVILNAVIGVVQESRAERSLEALQKLSAPTACVIRGGKTVKIPSSQVVRGDIIRLAAGDLVPADARLIESNGLKTQESALTGESLPCDKDAATVLHEQCSLAETVNCVFASTVVTCGSGKAVVTHTGMDTKVGHIAGLLGSEKAPPTPLQTRLAKISRLLGIGAVCICAIVFLLGLARGTGLLSSFMLAVSLAVAAIPEGLPAIVTVVLSMGVQKMSKSNAIIRRLPAVETLGAATCICSDKTGTLTCNRMTVTEVRSPEGTVLSCGSRRREILQWAAICCNSEPVMKGKKLVARGEPTENAILLAAANEGIDAFALPQDYPRLHEQPFDSSRKLMSTLNRLGSTCRLTVKGAPDVLLGLCTQYTCVSGTAELTAQAKERILRANEAMAREALRVIAVAYRTAKNEKDSSESNLIFLGLIGMIDPPRETAAKSVEVCKGAGITPVMITGDHILTARAIAKKLGILEGDSKAMTGAQLDKLSQEELTQAVRDIRVFARVTPEHKVRIVKALRARGEIVAMTGDGVNDAPALKAADIGCAMGKSGTEVAKSASDMVLTDDDFSTIVTAVRLGRGIYDNIKKSVHFLLSSNIGEILAIFFSSLMGFHSPLLPIQLLWVNLVTDSLPALALGTEPANDDIMERKPVSSSKGFFADGLWLDIVLEGILVGALTLLAFGIGRFFPSAADAVALGRTMAFCTLSLCELAHAVNMRSEHSIFKTGIMSNKRMLLAVPVCAAMQISVILVPSFRAVFKVCALSPLQWAVVAALSLVPLVVGEIGKIRLRDE